MRDAIVGEPGADRAHATDDGERGSRLHHRRSPDTIEQLVAGWADAVWTQGKRFGTVGMPAGGGTYEITTHRAEAYRPDSRHPRWFRRRVEADLSRRDFTINAMALRLPELELIDPFDGLADLSARRLRTPLDPDGSFGDDPSGCCGGPFPGQARARPGRRIGGGGAHRTRAVGHRVGRAHP